MAFRLPNDPDDLEEAELDDVQTCITTVDVVLSGGVASQDRPLHSQNTTSEGADERKETSYFFCSSCGGVIHPSNFEGIGRCVVGGSPMCQAAMCSPLKCLVCGQSACSADRVVLRLDPPVMLCRTDFARLLIIFVFMVAGLAAIFVWIL